MAAFCVADRERGIAHPWAMLGLPAALWAISPVRARPAPAPRAPELIAVLGETGRLQIVFGVLLTVGLAL